MLCLRTSKQKFRICFRHYSTQVFSPTSAPPLLVKVRDDMKAAMKAKDRVKLDVLRGLIAEITNAAKTSSPVSTDSHMLKLIQKKIKSSQEAVTQFDAAKRVDLGEKESAQIQVLEEYVKTSGMMSEEDLTLAIQNSIGAMRTEGLKTDKGSVMKRLVGPGGDLENQLVDKKAVARIVDGIL